MPRYEVSYKAVIQHYASSASWRPSSAGPVPPIIAISERGAVGVTNFQMLRTDPTFLYR
jgi:hypothetical protein